MEKTLDQLQEEDEIAYRRNTRGMERVIDNVTPMEERTSGLPVMTEPDPCPFE